MSPFKFTMEVEIEAPNQEAATAERTRLATLVFEDENVVCVGASEPVEGSLPEPPEA